MGSAVHLVGGAWCGSAPCAVLTQHLILLILYHRIPRLRRRRRRACFRLDGDRWERAAHQLDEAACSRGLGGGHARGDLYHTWCTRSAVHLLEGARCGSAPCVALAETPIDERSLSLMRSGERPTSAPARPPTAPLSDDSSAHQAPRIAISVLARRPVPRMEGTRKVLGRY